VARSTLRGRDAPAHQSSGNTKWSEWLCPSTNRNGPLFVLATRFFKTSQRGLGALMTSSLGANRDEVTDPPPDERSTQRRGPIRVLHVSEAFGGGVAASIHGMAANAPDARHIVLILRHRRHFGHDERLEGITYIDAGKHVPVLRALRCMIRTYRQWAPDVVHVHSSYAGVYVRIVPQIPRSKIVYTPHCYPFEQTNLSRPLAALLRLLERLLARRTGVLLAVSEHEARLAQSLSPRLTVFRAINAPQLPEQVQGSARAPKPSERIVVAAVGRVCPQKDPSYFAEVVRIARKQGTDVDWVWIGDGDSQLRRELEHEGVLVTGWLERESTLQSLSSCHMCLHTAAWEVGMPLTVLEAAGMGIPSVVRALSCMEGVGIGIHVRSPGEAAAQIKRLCDGEHWSIESEASKQAFLSLQADRHLANALAETYRLVASGKPIAAQAKA